MNKLYIVRHGQTDWNVEKRLQGKTDIELNSKGRDDAKELSKKIDLSDIDICISSPLKRTKETAEILANNRIPIIYDDLLVERGFGTYEENIIDFDLVAKQWDYNLNDSSNSIESIQDCLLRAKIFLDKIEKDYPNQNILIVTHGAFMKALHYNLVGYDENTDFLSFNPDNLSLYEYEIKTKENVK